MVATFNDNTSTAIISCYSLTNVREEMDLMTFYNELFTLIHGIPKYNTLIIGGDKNGQKIKIVNNKFSFHNLSNRNG